MPRKKETCEKDKCPAGAALVAEQSESTLNSTVPCERSQSNMTKWIDPAIPRASGIQGLLPCVGPAQAANPF